MFKKILIANRGEIACRIMRTARAMGIGTVAVYSEADADARHVREADEAIAIGAAPAAQSYLNIERIVETCRGTGAEAVHPGYGFLSENRAFAAALKQAGVVFIGPTAEAIAAMGDKIESKKLAQKAKVNVVPGHLGVIKDDKEAVKIARDIGYPVMLKASAGGGGKGMRIARSDQEVREGFRGASSEARSSFADDRVFIEKFIENPRHIEIQVLGDSHGNIVHLGERECSIQRRHQKVIEEAPSPFLDERTRGAMGRQAVALASAVSYQSAGTVEFIVDAKKHFYFLEMNTRLQVEHPVTELVTGFDLVEQMIRVAAGEKLPFKQKDVKHEGWAVEARVYAEDPVRGFLPSTGRLVRYREPPAGGDVRVDSGVYEGAEISMFYDPMIAKVIGYGADRGEAIGALRDALDAFYIRGVSHNIGFLTALLHHPRFIAGRLSTGFIAEEYPNGFAPIAPNAEEVAVLSAIATTVELLRRDRLDRLSGRLAPHSGVLKRDWEVKIGEEYIPVSVVEGMISIPLEADLSVAGAPPVTVVSEWRPGEMVWHGSIGQRRVSAQIRAVPNGIRIAWKGMAVTARAMLPRTAALDRLMPVKLPPDTSKMLLCPMPGLVVSIAVEDGQEVKAGETLAVVEAMKMENVLRAERDLTVAKINARPGDSLAVDAVIMEFA
jgi:propionyl-CoA carboxylase alpha chain